MAHIVVMTEYRKKLYVPLPVTVRPIVRSLSSEAVKTLVIAFISSRLDYCNSLLLGMSDCLLSCGRSSLFKMLQHELSPSVPQDAATSSRCYVCQLHWLLVRRWINFKIACIVHQSLSGWIPSYLSANIHLIGNCGCQNLYSASDRTYIMPHTHNTYSDRCFPASGPWVCISLPADIRLETEFISPSSNSKRYCLVIRDHNT